MGRNHQADDIRTRMAPPQLDDLFEVGRHMISTIARLAILVTPPFGSSDEEPKVIRPDLDFVKILPRHAQHVQDHVGRHQDSDVFHEVHLSAFITRLEDVVNRLDNLRLKTGNHGWREYRIE